MKRLTILMCLSFLTTQFVEGQKNEAVTVKSTQALHDMFIQKHKTNKIVGWVMLGTGIGMTIGGAAINLDQGWNINLSFSGNSAPEQASNQNKGLWLCYVGGATTLASIPFFISAGSNKRKAILALRGETVSIRSTIPHTPNYTALAVTIQLGRNSSFQKERTCRKPN